MVSHVANITFQNVGTGIVMGLGIHFQGTKFYPHGLTRMRCATFQFNS